MSKHAQLVFAVFMLAIAMAAIEMATQDWRNEAQANEEQRCQDEPDRIAYFARKPNENHNVETCIKVARVGDPRWVPILGDPMIYGAGIKGKPGLEQQLQWVRNECRKLAKQLKQQC